MVIRESFFFVFLVEEPAVKMRSKSLTKLDQLVKTMGNDQDEDMSKSGTLR